MPKHAAFKNAIGHLAAVPDELSQERTQTIVRVIISLIVLVYMIATDLILKPNIELTSQLLIASSYIGLATILMVLAFHDTSSSGTRRAISNIFDNAAISYAIISSAYAGIPLFGLYLWTMVANGLRFGLKALALSAALSIIGFSTVLAYSSPWQQMSTVSICAMLSLILFPLVAGYVLAKHRAITLSSAAKAPETVDVGKTSLRERIAALKARMRLKRHDELGREQGQAVVRVVIVTGLLVYLTASHRSTDLASQPPVWLLYLVGFLVFSLVMMVSAYRDQTTSHARRIATNVGDIATISYLMASTGEAGLPFFILYLWVTLGNGFRFGVRSLMFSTVLSIVGFSAVIIASNLWQAQATLASGIMIGLLVIPAYTAHLIQQLHVARQRAEEASAAKGHFLARMSHELRTPLNGILGTAELLSANKRLGREDRSLLDIIKESVKVSMRQIDNVLDFSKMDAGKLVIEQAEFDLHDLLNRTIRLLRGVALEKNLRLTLRIDPVVPLKLIGDPHHIQEVLINLLSNAVKFTHTGYVSLDATLVHQDERSVLIRLEVHDTGIGIDPGALGRIFEAFSQEDTGTTRRYGGTGLGTTIAKQLVELMGGRLGVNSTKGRGSVFYAELRFPTPTTTETRQLAGLRTLLISKNTALYDRLNSRSHGWGISINIVPSATEAIGLIARGIRLGNPFHVVLAEGETILGNGASKPSVDDFLQKCSMSITPVFLVCDVAPDSAQLRAWGYAGVLPYEIPIQMLYNALHACGYSDVGNEQGVVRIEPWAWGQSARVRPRVLIADDNRTNLMILQKILEAANYDVDAAEDGEQALEKMLNGRYKAAIVDMHMPGLDGIGVIKQYRIMQRGARTPIIMLTANTTVDAKLESADAGADAYLTKPATATTIVSTIEKLLEDSEIHELAHVRERKTATEEKAVLDTSLLTELDRLYNNPEGLNQILDEFESESRRLLGRIADAIKTKNHAAFCDLLHALKGNGANVGALRLAQVSEAAEGCGLMEFRRDGEQLHRQLDQALSEAVTALRAFTAINAADDVDRR